MMFKNFSFLSMIGCLALLVGCESSNISSSSTDITASNDGLNFNGNVMVVYFSATGHTKDVAEIISDYLEAPIYELEPVLPYSSEDLNYNDSNSRVNQERNDPDHITELVDVTFDEFDESDYIFLGAPVWFGELSWVIDDFVLSNDFTDKTIIPFATASSSDFDVEDLKDLSEEATWMEGRRFLQSEISEENVIEWIDSLN